MPSVAFSGDSTKQEAWTLLSTSSASITAAKEYAELTTKFLDVVFDQPKATPAYLPDAVTVNVNFPEITDSCTADNVQWVQARTLPLTIGSPDVVVCGGNGRLPNDSNVTKAGCFASVSVINASSKLDVGKDVQADVYARLKALNFACLP